MVSKKLNRRKQRFRKVSDQIIHFQLNRLPNIYNPYIQCRFRRFEFAYIALLNLRSIFNGGCFKDKFYFNYVLFHFVIISDFFAAYFTGYCFRQICYELYYPRIFIGSGYFFNMVLQFFF